MDRELKEFLPLLEKSPLFEGVQKGAIAILIRALGGKIEHFPAGCVLWHRGDEVKFGGIVLSGGVQAEQNSLDGTLHIVARHGNGAVFGDILTSSRRQKSPVDIVSYGDTWVLFFPLRELMRDNGTERPEALVRVRLNLLSGISDKYWALYRRLDVLCAPTMREKMARYLLNERDLHGCDTFSLSGTRETLAAELGVNRSALCRVLGEMRRAGLLNAKRNHVTLLDISSLRRLAGQ